jgi:hypothetical protein
VVYDTATKQELAQLEAAAPSGVFMTARADRIGL